MAWAAVLARCAGRAVNRPEIGGTTMGSEDDRLFDWSRVARSSAAEVTTFRRCVGKELTVPGERGTIRINMQEIP